MAVRFVSIGWKATQAFPHNPDLHFFDNFAGTGMLENLC